MPPNDGINRTVDQAEKLAADISAAISSPAGEALFQYMKAVSTNRVMPTTGTSEALWHLEGMRHMVYLINSWREWNNERRSNRSGSDNGRNTSAKSK